MVVPLSNLSLHYVIAGGLNIVVLLFFVLLLFRNFFQKRTIGTFLLIMAYSNLLLNEVLATAAFLWEGLTPSTDIVAATYSKLFQITGVILLVYTINWIYFFGNRHLIRDNDLFKAAYTSVFGGVAGAVIALAFQDIFKARVDPTFEPIWYTKIPLEGTNFNLYYPPADFSSLTILITVGLFLIGSYTYVRLSFRTFTLQRKAKDIVAKKGFQVVTASILLLLFTGLSLAFYILGAGNYGYLASLLYVVRGGIVMAAVVTGYIGWIMPEWIRKRFRGKAWLTKVYTGKIPEPEDIKQEPKGNISTEIIEVTET